MTDLYLVVDTGGSQTKIIFQQPGQRTRFLMMNPQVEPISPAALARYQERRGWMGAPAPIQQAWLRVDESVWVVGAFADQFDPIDRLRERKYENALYKILAAVGILHQQCGLAAKTKLKIFLGVLLPWDEFGDRKRFEAQLKAMLANFYFQDHKLSVKVEQFVCQPEGGGLAATALRQRGRDRFQSTNLAVLLFGHRNTSALIFKDGQLQTGSSPLNGFVNFLEAVAETFGSVDKAALTSAIAQAVKARHRKLEDRTALSMQLILFSWEEQPEIQALVQARLADLQQQELKDLVAAIEQAEEWYWQKIEKWLVQVLPRDWDEIIVSGGAARFLEIRLEDYLDELSPRSMPTGRRRDMLWNGGLDETLQQVFQFSRFSYDASADRLADAYGLFDYLVSLKGTTR